MKIVFCSNYMNHHQLYLAKALMNEGIDYTFIACEKIEQERIDNGWEDMNTKYNFVFRMYESEENVKIAKQLIYDADLVISGSFPFKILRERIFSNKPLFLYMERLFKNSSGDTKEFMTIHNFFSNLIHRTYLNFFNVYMLCASAYTAHDLSLYNNFNGKCYKWGYFPKVEEYDINELIKLKKENDKAKILWVARFIDWKHPEDMLYLANKLKEEGLDFEIDMIGVGPLLQDIENHIAEENLGDYIKLCGSMPNEEVKKYMLQSNIFVFTSDFNEGWGVVLNEAMNSGCAVVASHGIGSVPYLLRNGENGYIYNLQDKDEIVKYVSSLIRNQKLRENMSLEAYNTIINEWNSNNAAKKLLLLYDNLINHKNNKIEQGVCSKAEVLTKDWIKENKK